jgi:hypothetical protein
MRASDAQKILASLFRSEDAAVMRTPQFQEWLTAYIELELEGQDAARVYPQVHVQIAKNPAVREMYEDLHQLFRQEQANGWLEPPLTATFYTQVQTQQNAPALSQPAVAGVTWLLDKTNRLLITLSTEFIEKLVWPPVSQPATKTLKARAPRPLVAVTSPAEIMGVTATLQVREGRRPTHCDLLVEVRLPDRGLSHHAGLEVVAASTGVPPVRQRTDGFGKVRFAELHWGELETLTIEIQLR